MNEDITKAREKYGVSIQDIISIMKKLNCTANFAGAYCYANGCAVAVKGDRHNWCMSYAKDRTGETV